MTAREMAKDWKRRGLPKDVPDMLNGGASRVRFVDVLVVPDDWREADPDNDNGRPSCRGR